MSRIKIEYLGCKFNDVTHTIEYTSHLKRGSSKYLGSLIQRNGKVDYDVTYHNCVLWTKYRLASGVLFDKNIPPKLKGKFYIMVIKLIMLYGVKVWPVKNTNVQKMIVTKMSMLRWVCRLTRKDKIRK